MKQERMAVAYYRSAIADKSSIENQRQKTKEYASMHDLTIVQEFADNGCSGLATNEDLKRRVGFCELNEFILGEHSKSGHILMRDISRISRDQYFTEQILHKWKERGWKTIFLDQN